MLYFHLYPGLLRGTILHDFPTVTQHVLILPHACYMHLPNQSIMRDFRNMYGHPFENGGQTQCTKTKAGGDLFWPRQDTLHVAEMLTSPTVCPTASQHFCCRCQASELTFGLLRACCPVSGVHEHVEHCLYVEHGQGNVITLGLHDRRVMEKRMEQKELYRSHHVDLYQERA